MVVIGIGYFPLFTALALESVVSHVIGTAYAWMLLIKDIYQLTECEYAPVCERLL